MKRHFTCKSNWTGAIIAYTPKMQHYNINDIDRYNIFNNGVIFANASYIKIPLNTEGAEQGWCWGLFQKYDSSLPYVSWLTSGDTRHMHTINMTVEQEVNFMSDAAAEGFYNIKFATVEEVKKLKDLVADDKIKLACDQCSIKYDKECNNKEETLNFLEL
ncbi:hypothetical protein [Rickettsia endosymbiont of Halotydeus destructor]|uniref:hypothetical protein n=1 Tax=Rickettsia endosymbiont of Halotydeus destructor TaxID=2996754 RepID=UPI003BAFA5E6